MKKGCLDTGVEKGHKRPKRPGVVTKVKKGHKRSKRPSVVTKVEKGHKRPKRPGVVTKVEKGLVLKQGWIVKALKYTYKSLSS